MIISSVKHMSANGYIKKSEEILSDIDGRNFQIDLEKAKIYALLAIANAIERKT